MKSQAEAEPWEALDVDDSELPSFLRPCKRKFSPPPSPPLNQDLTLDRNSNRRQILHRCSSSRSSESLNPNPYPIHGETSSSSSRCLIPGPAGAVQAAMRRKLQKDPSSLGEHGDPIPTQEYIRRAVEEPGREDEDFSGDPWISTVDYIRSEGLLGDDGVGIGTPVSVIKSGFSTWDKVNQVVAIVKSCTPNGLGDLMVTLKDPTGTIDASVHRKAVTESESGRDIRVGAVLILRKVAVCTPTRLSCYLNITLNNIFKIITQDTLSSLKQNNPARATKDPVPIVETEKCLQTQPKASSLDPGKMEGIMNSLRQRAHVSSETHTDVEMEDVIPSEGSDWHKDVTMTKDQRVEEALVKKQDSNSKTETAAADRTTAKLHQEQHWDPERRTQEDVVIDIDTADWQELLVDEQVSRSHQTHCSQPGNGMASCGNSCDRDAMGAKVDERKAQMLSTSSATEVEKTQPLPSTGSVPQWTDEQLEELFAFD